MINKLTALKSWYYDCDQNKLKIKLLDLNITKQIIMKKFLLAFSVFTIMSCSKNDSSQTGSTSTDSLASDSTAAVPNPAPQTDSATSSTSGATSGTMSDSTSNSSPLRRDSAR